MDIFDNNFNFCPKCGGNMIKNYGNRKRKCDCGFELYNNVAASALVIIQDKTNNVLFEVRAKDPQKGFLGLPGGFLEPGEDLETGAIRECEEEIGLKIKDIKYLCSYPNTYIYNNIEYKVCDNCFLVNTGDDLIENIIKKLFIQESEVSHLVYHKIETINDIDSLPIAFESAKYALKYNLNHKG